MVGIQFLETGTETETDTGTGTKQSIAVKCVHKVEGIGYHTK